MYRMLVRLLSVGSLAPISILAAELVPTFPLKTSRQADIFGFDVEEWTPNAFAWAFKPQDLSVISQIVKDRGGAWSAIKNRQSVLPILAFGLAKAGSLGVLLQFFLTNFTVGEVQHQHQMRVGGGLLARWTSHLSPGQTMLIHYIFSCLALRCCQTPKNPRNAMVYSVMCALGCWFEVSLVENLIRKAVLKYWPQLEVAELAT